MIISRTPYRVSLFGGGTDYPKWFRQHGGAVLGFAINKYCYISLRSLPPFFEHRHRIVYSRIELVGAIEEIQHPSVRAVLGEMQVTQGIEIQHQGDLPARSGLGSSSSFTVGLLNALWAQNGRMATKAALAAEAIRIEQEVIRENVGSQDQIWAAYGGMNRIEFNPDGSFAVHPVVLPQGRRRALMESLMLVFSGFSRFADRLAAQQIANMDRREAHLHALRGLVDDALVILQDPARPIAEIGELLHHSWMLKRDLSDSITSPSIDAIYQTAREAGAIGGKLLGAGGGGFMLFFVPPERQAAVRERLRDLIHVGFDIDPVGSRIVVYEPDDFEHP